STLGTDDEFETDDRELEMDDSDEFKTDDDVLLYIFEKRYRTSSCLDGSSS
ncbi:3808_t:CDS:1, partial [Funneliformis geosporum]